MSISITEEASPDWRTYAAIESRFIVGSILDVLPSSDGTFSLVERSVAAPWEKNYDAIPNEHPTDWPRQFDVRPWAVLLAHADGELAGGAVVATDSPELDMLEHCPDLAVLWDIRVRPDWRGRGVGTRLFRAAAELSGRRGKRELKVETQNINAPACRFYARMGCELRVVTPGTYASLPDEMKLLWYLRLL